MKSLLFVTTLILLAAFTLVNAGAPCRREISVYTVRHIVCAKLGNEIQSYFSPLALGNITSQNLTEIIPDLCDRAKLDACYNDISKPIAGACNNAESFQHFRNAFKIVLIFDAYLCQNNGQKYFDFIKDGGAECYLNEKKAKCYADGKKAANLGQLKFKDENVCTVLAADWECLRHYDDCKNRNVGAYYRQILSLIREKFSC